MKIKANPLLLAPPAAPTLKQNRNPLLYSEEVQSCDVGALNHRAVIELPVTQRKRELRDLRRAKSAKEAIAGLTKENEIYGFTKAQFSLIDLIVACLEHTGPAHLFISTWTAARNDITKLRDLKQAGRLGSVCWLVDFTFCRRDPEAAQLIRETFGVDCIRVALNHAKCVLFTNDDWRLLLRTSMNLNINPRFEDFTLRNDQEAAAFVEAIVAEIWRKQSRALAFASLSEQRNFFVSEL